MGVATNSPHLCLCETLPCARVLQLTLGFTDDPHLIPAEAELRSSTFLTSTGVFQEQPQPQPAPLSHPGRITVSPCHTVALPYLTTLAGSGTCTR